MLVRLSLIIAGICLTQSAAAVCYYEGRPYPTGAHVNGYTCQPDGTWKKGGRYPDSRANPLTQARGVMRETASPVASASG